MSTVSLIPVPLDQVPRSRSGARSNHRAFPPANQRTANQSGSSADQCAFGPTVMNPVTPVTALAVHRDTAESSE